MPPRDCYPSLVPTGTKGCVVSRRFSLERSAGTRGGGGKGVLGMGEAIRIEVAGPAEAADLVRALAARGLPARVALDMASSVEVVSLREDTADVLRDLVPVLDCWRAGDESAAVRLVVGATAEPARPLAAA